jgi:hypothetical protein
MWEIFQWSAPDKKTFGRKKQLLNNACLIRGDFEISPYRFSAPLLQQRVYYNTTPCGFYMDSRSDRLSLS